MSLYTQRLNAQRKARHRYSVDLAQTNRDRMIRREACRECGARVVIGGDLTLSDSELGVSVKTPVPPEFAYHPLENPHGTRSRFDVAVSLDREYLAGKQKRNRDSRDIREMVTA